MNTLVIQGIVLVLMLVVLPLASLGTTTDGMWLNVLALVVFGLASLTPPVLRFAGGSGDDDDENNGNDKEK